LAFIVDPIDGTENFTANLSLFGGAQDRGRTAKLMGGVAEDIWMCERS